MANFYKTREENYEKNQNVNKKNAGLVANPAFELSYSLTS